MATSERSKAEPPRPSAGRPPDDAGLHAGTSGLPRRALALLVDYGVLFAASAAISGLVGLAGLEGDARRTVAALLSFALIVLYFAALESSTSQGTLGKIILGLQVTDDDGRPIRFGRALGRTLAKLLSLAPFGVGFLMAAFSERNRALHDLLAGTLVQRVR